MLPRLSLTNAPFELPVRAVRLYHSQESLAAQGTSADEHADTEKTAKRTGRV